MLTAVSARGRWKVRTIRNALGAALAAITLTLATPGAAIAAPIYSTPDPDPFYAQPPGLADKKPGDILAVRAMPPLTAFPGTTVTMIKFRSTNSEGKPIAATTTVLTPINHRVDGPLLSYQHIINGLGWQCAVSHELYTADPNLVIREAPALNIVLVQGWSVVLPDHLGPDMAYGAAKYGGQITLDSIRAAQRLPQLGVTHSPVALAGYSGGGMATAWAAAIAPRYAPELHLIGSAEGGVPMNLVKMVETLGFNRHPAFGLAMAAAIGLEREYPDRLPIVEQMNRLGLTVAHEMANGCTNDIIVDGAWHDALDFARTTSLISSKSARQVVQENSLELYNGVPNIPIFEWHSPTDVLLPVDAITNVVHRYCTAGVVVDSKLYPSPDHLTTAVIGLPEAFAWLESRFEGIPAPDNCPPRA
jgi:pimeloyl-ACP methyl ester carboxylesterase